MSSAITCRCGQRLPMHGSTDQSIDCVRCGQQISVVMQDRNRTMLWVLGLVALLSTIATAGLVGYLVGRPKPQAVVVETRPEPVVEAKANDTIPAIPVIKKQEPKPVEPAPPAPQELDVPELLPVPKHDLPEPAPPKVNRIEANREPVGGYTLGEVITQDVVFARRSAYSVAGIELGQGAKYSFQSTLTIKKVNKDGSMLVEQKIAKTKLIEADADMKATLTDALDKAVGEKFEIAISPLGEATVTGVKDPINIKQGQQALGDTVRLWSLLDADAWRELAGITFFQPARALRENVTWTIPATHDWGPLGTWTGKTIYVSRGKTIPKSKLDVIDYGHRIDHAPAKPGAANKLPIELLNVKFTPVTAEGRMQFNGETQRTTAAEESFRVRGVLTAAMAGSAAEVEMQEYQGFQLTIVEPNEAKLVGVPGKK
jgi:hypothetical protein